MALDAYVMPLWRFKAGNFASPIQERLGIKPIYTFPGIRKEVEWNQAWR